jgi:hypothetical protein
MHPEIPPDWRLGETKNRIVLYFGPPETDNFGTSKHIKARELQRLMRLLHHCNTKVPCHCAQSQLIPVICGNTISSHTPNHEVIV